MHKGDQADEVQLRNAVERYRNYGEDAATLEVRNREDGCGDALGRAGETSDADPVSTSTSAGDVHRSENGSRQSEDGSTLVSVLMSVAVDYCCGAALEADLQRYGWRSRTALGGGLRVLAAAGFMMGRRRGAQYESVTTSWSQTAEKKGRL